MVNRGVIVAVTAVSVLGYGISAGATSENPQVRRIQTRFDSVLVELQQRDTRGLAASQQARRAKVLATFQQYRDRGQFPNNYDFPGQATPYFVDRKTGTLCAVAHLLQATGRMDIVDRVARTNNNVWVAELASDSALTNWLIDHGVTFAEAARIQEPYVYDPEPVSARSYPQASHLPGLAIISTSGVALANALTNRDGHGRVRNVLGIAAGAASVGIGAASFSTSDRTLAVSSVAVGTLSAVLSTRGFLQHRKVASKERGLREASLSVAPTISSTQGSGVTVSVRF